MTIDRRALAGVLAALLLVSACGGSASSAPTTEPAASATPEATQAPATAEPTATPAATEPAGTEGPSLAPGAATELEALLPSQVGGVTFQKASFDGSSYPGGIPIGEGGDELTTLLTENGKTLNDVNIAVATPTDSTAAGTMIMAIQIEGIPSQKLVDFATASMDGAEKTTIGGKEVYGAAQAGFGAYIYVKDDVMFYILAMGGENITEEILAALP